MTNETNSVSAPFSEVIATADKVSISVDSAWSHFDGLANARSEDKEIQVKPKSRKKHHGRIKPPSKVSKARLARAIAMVRGNTIYGLKPPNAKRLGGGKQLWNATKLF